MTTPKTDDTLRMFDEVLDERRAIGRRCEAEGYAAGSDGLPPKSCPYAKSTPEWRHWTRGWRKATEI